MKPSYHYITVSKPLEDLKEKGFTYDYNIYQNDIKKKSY